jgi:hypothetical protein
LRFAGAGAVAEGVGAPDQHAVAEAGDQYVADLRLDLVEVVVAGAIRRVDQFAQRAGDLARPDRFGVDLGGVVEVAQHSWWTSPRTRPSRSFGSGRARPPTRRQRASASTNAVKVCRS